MRKLLAWWVRMHMAGAAVGLRRAYKVVQRAQQARAEREVLARLDMRALKDIGLESWNGELAERVHAYRQHQARIVAAARIGAF